MFSLRLQLYPLTPGLPMEIPPMECFALLLQPLLTTMAEATVPIVMSSMQALGVQNLIQAQEMMQARTHTCFIRCCGEQDHTARESPGLRILLRMPQRKRFLSIRNWYLSIKLGEKSRLCFVQLQGWWRYFYNLFRSAV